MLGFATAGAQYKVTRSSSPAGAQPGDYRAACATVPMRRFLEERKRSMHSDMEKTAVLGDVIQALRVLRADFEAVDTKLRDANAKAATLHTCESERDVLASQLKEARLELAKERALRLSVTKQAKTKLKAHRARGVERDATISALRADLDALRPQANGGAER